MALGGDEGEDLGDEGCLAAACVAVKADGGWGAVLGADDEVEDWLGLFFATGDLGEHLVGEF